MRWGLTAYGHVHRINLVHANGQISFPIFHLKYHNTKLWPPRGSLPNSIVHVISSTFLSRSIWNGHCFALPSGTPPLFNRHVDIFLQGPLPGDFRPLVLPSGHEVTLTASLYTRQLTQIAPNHFNSPSPMPQFSPLSFSCLMNPTWRCAINFVLLSSVSSGRGGAHGPSLILLVDSLISPFMATAGHNRLIYDWPLPLAVGPIDYFLRYGPRIGFSIARHDHFLDVTLPDVIHNQMIFFYSSPRHLSWEGRRNSAQTSSGLTIVAVWWFGVRPLDLTRADNRQMEG